MKHSHEEIELVNGSKVLLLDVPGSTVVNLVAGFNAGYMCAEPGLSELPHLMEHTVVGANAKFPTMKDFEAEIEKNGAANNAFTSQFFLGYEMECASFEFDRILELLTTEITTPAFKPIEITAEMGNVREELNRNLTNYSRVAYDQIASATLGRHTTDDGLASLDGITRDKILDYYHKTHTARNLKFIFAGAIKENRKYFDTLNDQLSKLKAGRHIPIVKETPKHQSKPLLIHKDIPQLYYQFTQYGPTLPLSDDPALEILGIILTGRYKSWILGEARDRGLAYFVNSGADTGIHYSSFSVMYNATPSNTPDLFKLIADKMALAVKGEFTETEVKEAKNLLIGRRLRQHKTPGNLVNWYLYDYLTRSRVNDFYESIAMIEKITVSDLARAIKRIFAKPCWGLSLVGDIDEKQANELNDTLATIWR